MKIICSLVIYRYYYHGWLKRLTAMPFAYSIFRNILSTAILLYLLFAVLFAWNLLFLECFDLSQNSLCCFPRLLFQIFSLCCLTAIERSSIRSRSPTWQLIQPARSLDLTVLQRKRAIRLLLIFNIPLSFTLSLCATCFCLFPP